MKSIRILICLLLALSNIASATPITIVLQGMDEACGGANGTVKIQILYGGNPPYTFLWSSGAITTGNLTNISAGTYSLLVTDANGDTASASYTINNNPFLNAGALTYLFPGIPNGGAHPCKTFCNGIGFLELYAINGTAPYSLFAYCATNTNITTGFSSLYNSLTVENICSNDIYTVLLTDANGCSGNPAPTYNYLPTSFAFNSTIFQACNGVANGSVSFDFYDSQSFPYSLNFTGPTTQTLSYNFQGAVGVNNLLPGTYQFTVTNTVTASLCDSTFTIVIPDAGFNCGTVSGQVYLDTIRNCNMDASEPLLAGRLIEFNPGNYFATSDNFGNYTAKVPYGTYTVSTISSSNYFSVCDSTGIVVSAISNSITNVNIADSSNVGFDVAVGMYNSAIRPGFDFSLYLDERNLSYISCSSSIVSIVFPSNLTFVSSTLPSTLVGNNQVDITFGALNTFQINNAHLIFSTPPDPNLIGTNLGFTASLTSGCPENNLTNNTTSINPLVTGSFDPNDKTVAPMNGLDNFLLVDVDSLLTYTIRFQNTGTDTAFNIVVVDTLDMNLNVASFQFVGSSHPSHWELTGHNILKVYFNTILLPDSNTNESESHSAFCYKIFTKQVSQIGNIPYILNNKADIYFDFNPPVTTNTIFNTLDVSVGLNEHLADKTIQLFPNPVSKKLFVKIDNALTLTAIRIIDLQGRQIKNSNQSGNIISIDVSGFQSGVYLIDAIVKDTKGSTYHLAPQRLVKE